MMTLKPQAVKELIEQRLLRTVLGDFTVILAFGLSLVCYLLGTASTVQGMDAGEFMTVSALGGRLHPPGYPSAVYLMQLAQHLPFGTVAWKASSVSAVFGAATVGVCAAMIFRITLSRVAALSISLILAVQPLWLRYFTVAEVFAPAAFAMALLTWLAVEVQFGLRGRRVIIWLGLISGFAATNHHGYVFAGPLVLWIMWAAQLGIRGSLASVGLGTLCLVLYLPLLSTDGAWVWGSWSDLEGLFRHIIRADYGTLTLRPGSLTVSWWAHPLAYLKLLPMDLMVLPFCLMLFGLWRGRTHGLTWALFGTWVLAGLGFFSMFNIPTTGESGVIAQRFMVPIIVLMVPLMAMALVDVHRRKEWQLILCTVPVVAASMHVGRVEHGYDTRLEDYIRNTCEQIPDQSVMIIETDGMIFGMLYAQEVLGLCPTVIMVHPEMMSYSWYIERLRVSDPDLFEGSIDLPDLIERAQKTRNVYANFSVLGAPNRVAALPPAVPELNVFRFLRPDEVLPLPQVVESNLVTQMEQTVWNPQPISPFLEVRTAEVWATNQPAHAWEALRNAYLVRSDYQSAERALNYIEIIRLGGWIEQE
ncbi:MAG: DUF2723 domain-containing protein [Myxococcota bacterium]|nr:DUF2723 domain-containing protein [Myxococcota bacterium]